MIKQKLQAIVGAERRNVPQCNWPNYDIEAADYIDAIVEEPEQFEVLTAKLCTRPPTCRIFRRCCCGMRAKQCRNI